MLRTQSKHQRRRKHSDKFDGQSLLWQWNLHCAKRCHATESSHLHQGTMPLHSRRSVELGPWCCHSHPGPSLPNQLKCCWWHGPVAWYPAAFCIDAKEPCSQCDAPIWFLPSPCRNNLSSGPMHDQYFEECGELSSKSCGLWLRCRRIANRSLAEATLVLVSPTGKAPQVRCGFGESFQSLGVSAASLQNPPTGPLHLNWWWHIGCQESL